MLIEFTGFVAFVLFTLFGMVDWPFFAGLFFFVYSFSVLYSAFAILMEVLTYNQYKKRHEVLKLLGTALVDGWERNHGGDGRDEELADGAGRQSDHGTAGRVRGLAAIHGPASSVLAGNVGRGVITGSAGLSVEAGCEIETL